MRNRCTNLAGFVLDGISRTVGWSKFMKGIKIPGIYDCNAVRR